MKSLIYSSIWFLANKDNQWNQECITFEKYSGEFITNQFNESHGLIFIGSSPQVNLYTTNLVATTGTSIQLNRPACGVIVHFFRKKLLLSAGGVSVEFDPYTKFGGLIVEPGESTFSSASIGPVTDTIFDVDVSVIQICFAYPKNHQIAGCFGDPHFRLWNSTHYSYHGECDLVLLDNKDFADGMGMDIHIRTTQRSFYSYIEAVAIRIGNDILEFAGNDDVWINGVQGSDRDLPTTIGDDSHFPLNHDVGTSDKKSYQIDLNDGGTIIITQYKHFISVSIDGSPLNFGTSVGLMGHYHTGDMLARDGITILHDPDEFGAEWQVQGDEEKLFHDTLREPQHPYARCKPVPETTKESRRHLRHQDASFVSAAGTACAYKGTTTHEFELCVHDVLATKDIGMAEAW